MRYGQDKQARNVIKLIKSMITFLSGDRMICGLDKICYSKGNLVNGFVCDCDCPFLRGLFTEQLDDLGGRMLRWTKEKSRSTYL